MNVKMDFIVDTAASVTCSQMAILWRLWLFYFFHICSL